MNKELQPINENETLTLTDLVSNKKAIGCKWVYKIKFDNQGNVSRYKARLVAPGYFLQRMQLEQQLFELLRLLLV